MASAVAATGGWFAYPLDDAYIHLGVARTLAEHGTWGVNPGEFASASSSPAWTATLAAIFTLTGPRADVALWVNLAAAALLFPLAAAWLRDEGAPETAVRAGCCALALAVPVPYLAALGMEHVLQLGTVLLLARSADRRVPTLALAAIAGIATLVRYETAFVAGWMALLLARERPSAAIATLAGSVTAVLGFGAWSVYQGGLFLPNSVLMKGAADRDWWASLVSAIDASGPILAVASVAAAGAAFLDTSGVHRRRVVLFVLVAATHLALARVGWLFRYEAYLVGWGVLLLVTPARLLLATQSALRVTPVALCVAGPVLVRAAEAFDRYDVGARSAYDTNVATARWVADTWPDATVATHDLGALAFYTDATLVDLAGLGTTELTRMHLDGAFTPDSASEVLTRRGVQIAFTGRTWMGGAPPTGFREAGSLLVPYPAGAGAFESVFWSVDPTARARLLQGLATGRHQWPARVRLTLPDEEDLDLAAAVREGAAVQHEADGLAFYTNGRATLDAPIPGRLLLTTQATEAEGRPANFTVLVGGRRVDTQSTTRLTTTDLGPVAAHDAIVLIYEDDTVDATGADRNLFVRRAVVSSLSK